MTTTTSGKIRQAVRGIYLTSYQPERAAVAAELATGRHPLTGEQLRQLGRDLAALADLMDGGAAVWRRIPKGGVAGDGGWRLHRPTDNPADPRRVVVLREPGGWDVGTGWFADAVLVKFEQDEDIAANGCTSTLDDAKTAALDVVITPTVRLSAADPDTAYRVLEALSYLTDSYDSGEVVDKAIALGYVALAPGVERQWLVGLLDGDDAATA